jgi:hypothetical protein
MTGGVDGVEMGGGGRARRAMPTHREECDEWVPSGINARELLGISRFIPTRSSYWPKQPSRLDSKSR